jgi:hypothetical protein
MDSSASFTAFCTGEVLETGTVQKSGFLVGVCCDVMCVEVDVFFVVEMQQRDQARLGMQ